MAGLFDLTKREQRVVAIIMLALVGGTIALHHRDLKTPMPTPAPASSAPPAAMTGDEDANETATPQSSPDR